MKCSKGLVLLATVLSPVAGNAAIASHCAGAVDDSTSAVGGKPGNCLSQLWTPTNDDPNHPAQDCFAYGGPYDPCSLNCNNDAKDGMEKDPSQCDYGNTFFLWDEPDTQNKDYKWAAESWLTYSSRWSSQIQIMRQNGFKFTTPLFKTDNIVVNIKTFFEACGPPCLNKSSPSYIDVLALNVFCGIWNTPSQKEQPTENDCRGGISWFWNDPQALFKPLRAMPNGEKWLDRPVYITNWAVIDNNPLQPDDQLAAMDATDEFFKMQSPSVEKVFWFGATNYMKEPGGKSVVVEAGNRMSDKLNSGKTIGEHWVETVCSKSRLLSTGVGSGHVSAKNDTKELKQEEIDGLPYGDEELKQEEIDGLPYGKQINEKNDTKSDTMNDIHV